MAFVVTAVPVAADTNVLVAGGTGTSAPVSTQARSANLKLSFIPTSTAAVVTVAETAAKVGAGNGFPLRATDPTVADVFQGDDEFELVSADQLWVRATEAGVLYVVAV